MKSIQRIKSVEQAERSLEHVQQFADPIVVFDVALDLVARSIPCRLMFCPKCSVAHYLNPDEYCPYRCDCGANYFVETAHIELIIQDDTVVYRREA